ncbi:Dot/Icm T4SS effector CegC2, partial [Legionella pneumophila]
TSTAFLGKFFGIQAEDIPYSKLDDIIKLKLMNPDEPVYISMSYGKVDSFGKFHGRHALRIDKIIPKGSGNYDFVLINPHDNSKTETYKLDDLNKRNCRFCLFNTSIHRASLTKKLLTLSNEEGRYIFSNSGLQKRLISLEEMHLLTDNKIISSCISLHKQIPYLEKLFLKLSVEEKKTLTACIANADGSKKEFLKLFLTRIPAMDLLELVLREETSQELLGEVLTELALSNPVEENKLSPKAGINFNGEAFLHLIVKSAIQQKINQLAYLPEKAKQEIESGLINFYFGGASSSLTRASGLRALFIANIFSKKSIEALFPPKALFAKAIANYLTLKTLPDLLIEYLKSKDTSPIDEEFFDVVLASATFKDPDEFFENLFRLSRINPEVAKALFVFASQKINVLFGISLEEYAKKIALKDSGEFKSWFESLSKPQPVIKIPEIDNVLRQQRVDDAKRVISDIVQRINSFPFSFEGFKTVEHVNLNAEELRGQLKKIVHSGELQNALQILDLPDGHPEVQRALERKLRMIDAAANRRSDFLRKYETDIDEHVRQIKNFPIDFNDADTIVAIESQRILLNKKLHTLVKAEDLLGEQFIANPKIKMVYYAQVEKINLRAELLQKRLLDEAQKVIDSVEKRIDNFVIRFNDISSTSAVEWQRNNLLQQLDNLVKPNQALLSSEKVLDCNNLQPSIVRALQAKKQEINETADQLIIKINAEEVVKSYEKQIREFPISFSRCQTVEEVIARKQDLIQSVRYLVDNKPDLLKAREQLQLSDEYHSDIKIALTDKICEINRQADVMSKRITDQIAAIKETLNILAEIKFSDHLKTIESMVKTLETKAVGDENYKRAAPIARTFYNNLLRAEEHFKNSQLPKNVKCNDFHQACVRAINAVMPVLEVHRGWKQVFADLASALVTLCTLGGANLYAGRWRLFPVPTESEKIVKDFSLSMQPLSVSA